MIHIQFPDLLPCLEHLGSVLRIQDRDPLPERTSHDGDIFMKMVVSDRRLILSLCCGRIVWKSLLYPNVRSI